MKFSSITWEGREQERPERLYRRLLAHLQDNMLLKGSKLKHNETTPTRNEEISPTVERLAVLRWMELLHPKLPALVAHTFAYDLQRMTLKDIQPQIADGLDQFLEELARDEIQATRVYAPRNHRNTIQFRPSQSRNNFMQKKAGRPSPNKPTSNQQCRLCKAEGRPFWGHTMTTCQYIADAEKQDLVRSYSVSMSAEDKQTEEVEEEFNHLHCEAESE
jgi:hypothetical protein